MGDPFGVIQKLEERVIQGESQGIIIIYHMDKFCENCYMPTKPLDISFILEESEVIEF